MNLRDKLRGSAEPESPPTPEPRQAAWQPAPEPAPEPAKKAAGKGSLLGNLDVNRRFLVLAAAAAGLTSLLAVMYLSSSASGLAEGGEKVSVLVAAQDIPAGVALTEDMLTTSDVPKAYLPKGYYEDIEKLKDRLAIAPMVEGEPILEVRTSAPNAKHGIAYLLKSGERAKSISVDSASGIAGLIKPGNEVDLIATIPDPNNDNRRIGTPILQKARVIAVGDQLLGEVRSPEEEAKESESGIDSGGTVTLAIPSAKTGLVTLLEDMGNLKMVLRAANDNSIVKTKFTDDVIMALVSGRVPPKEVSRPAPPRPVYVPPRTVVREVVREAPKPVHRPKPQPKPQPVSKPVSKPATQRNVEIIRFGGSGD